MTPGALTPKTAIPAVEENLPPLERLVRLRESNALPARSSTDELVAMQRLADTISTTTDAEVIVSELIALTRQVIPVIDCNVFVFDDGGRLAPLAAKSSSRLHQETERQMEAGIVDWVIAEKKTVTIPDLEHMVSGASGRNFVIVPLIVRNRGIGVYVIHTEKTQLGFSNQEVQLLSVLANQAAVGVENWRTHQQLIRANEELKASHAQMIQAAKLAAIGELAAGIAHEIKNPLQVLLLHLELVEAGRPMPNWTQMFGKQVRRLADITRRLMNFARSASEEVSMEPVSLRKVIDDIVAMVQHEFRGNGIEIVMDEGPEPPAVSGNSNYLQQVFLNLLINARDAMPSGGTITISVSTTGFHVCVRVSDTGSGIPPDLLEKIFRPFFTTKGEKGTGLGLAICHKIILQHKGDIRVESEPGKGTTFTIYLPIFRIPAPTNT